MNTTSIPSGQNPSIRIAHIMGRMNGGGVESTVLNHFRNADRDLLGFDFLVSEASSYLPRDEIEGRGGRVITLPDHKEVARYLIALRKYFVLVRPDIVHSHINSLSVLPLAAARSAGISIRIAHSHSISNPREKLRHLAKSVLRLGSRWFPTHLAACSSDAARWQFGERAFHAGKVRIIRNAIHLQAFEYDPRRRQEARQTLQLTENQFTVGHVGRMVRTKNQHFILEVFSEILKIRPNSVLLLVGDGPDRRQLEHQAVRLGIRDKVRFLGIRDDTAELYQAMDAFVFPSLYEGLGIALVEAQISGLCCFVSEGVPGEAFIVPENVTQFPNSAPVEVWAELLANVKVEGRRGYSSKGTKAGYDISLSASSLTGWYVKLAQ